MSLSPHRQAIAIFSIGLPSLLFIGLLVAVLHGRGKLHQSYSEKESNYRSYQQASTQVKDLEAMLALDDRRDKVVYWNEKLDRDFVQTLSTTLNKLLGKYDDSVLKQTEMAKATTAAAIGSKSDNPHTLFQLKFEGGFKPMQLLLAELEDEMPNLVLESLTMKVKNAQKDEDQSTLQFNVTYMGWEKPEA
ncbi:MAG: hypothetical protein P1U85_18550 [Verrucomicrobiales bacterium]|nr:hypothetical protein [Verrucomicrobiales bacterium]